jgi:acyl-CoA thioesterase
MTEFDRTTVVTPTDGRRGEFSVVLDPGWSSLVGIHGGYMCAIAARCAKDLAPGRTVRTMTASFLHAARVGPATLSVQEVRRGRSITTMVADLVQDGRALTTSRLTLLTERTGVEWSSTVPSGFPGLDQCVPLDPPAHIAHLDQAEALVDPDFLPFSGGDRALIRGYLRPREARPVDSAWLAMASDWFPPPAFVRLDPPTGGVSIDLTTHIHQPHLVLGEDEWLVGSFEVRDSSGGLAVEHGWIAQTDGTPVAESLQTRFTAED